MCKEIAVQWTAKCFLIGFRVIQLFFNTSSGTSLVDLLSMVWGLAGLTPSSAPRELKESCPRLGSPGASSMFLFPHGPISCMHDCPPH